MPHMAPLCRKERTIYDFVWARTPVLSPLTPPPISAMARHLIARGTQWTMPSRSLPEEVAAMPRSAHGPAYAFSTSRTPLRPRSGPTPSRHCGPPAAGTARRDGPGDARGYRVRHGPDGQRPDRPFCLRGRAQAGELRGANGPCGDARTLSTVLSRLGNTRRRTA